MQIGHELHALNMYNMQTDCRAMIDILVCRRDIYFFYLNFFFENM